jgi:AcrR family transcriptional regulator
MSPDSKRGPRADASRNAARLVAAAREVLAEAGNDAAFDVIARRAGVGNATLYRHFPTRADLLVAVYADEVTALCERGAQLLESAEPMDALFAWLDEFVVHVATKRPLALAATNGAAERPLTLAATDRATERPLTLAATDRATERPLTLTATDRATERRTTLFHQWHAAITSTAEHLVRRARPGLRSDVTAADVLTLASGAALVSDTAQACRVVAMLRSGIAAQPAAER